MSDDGPDDMELSRRVLADLEELNAEFHVGIDQDLMKLYAAEDALEIEAMGMAPRTFGDDTTLKLRDAIYPPILGKRFCAMARARPAQHSRSAPSKGRSSLVILKAGSSAAR